jgi:hypothetical protein
MTTTTHSITKDVTALIVAPVHPRTALCRCCKERPQLFRLADESGNPLRFASGFCRECTPVQPDEDPGLREEHVYRAKYHHSASLELVNSAPIEGWFRNPLEEWSTGDYLGEDDADSYGKF